MAFLAYNNFGEAYGPHSSGGRSPSVLDENVKVYELMAFVENDVRLFAHSQSAGIKELAYDEKNMLL